MLMKSQLGFKTESQHSKKVLSGVQNLALTHQESIKGLMKSQLRFKTESQHAHEVSTDVQI
jgi:hypothetical protein